MDEPWKALSTDFMLLDLIDRKPGPDPFPHGSVIRWTIDGRYTYAALKAPGGWYTTATRDPMVLTYTQLVETIARPDATAVTVAAFTQSRSIKP